MAGGYWAGCCTFTCHPPRCACA